MSRFTPDRSIVELRLEDIPEGTTEIDLSYCHSLTTLPATLPAGLTRLLYLDAPT